MNNVYGVYFSPAGKTGKIVKVITEKLAELSGKEIHYVPFTTPRDRETKMEFDSSDIVVLGTPTYAGRVPNKIMPFIRDEINGNGAVGAAVVTYGNRNYDDALIELETLMKNNSFKVIGSGAFVSEHSFAEALATGRPSEKDFIVAEKLAAGIAEKIQSGNLSEPETPGNKEFSTYYVPKGLDGKPAKFLKAKPVTDKEKCTACGKCATVCPMGSISVEDKYEVTGICIKCQACIKICPEHAKYFDDKAFLSHKAMLEQNFADRVKESEIYL